MVLEGTFSDAERLAREAIAMAEARGPEARSVLAHATTTLGVSLGWGDDPEAGVALLRRALALAEEAGDHDESFRVYAEVVSIPGISLPGLLKDLKGIAKRVDSIGKLEKAALVTDNQWLRMAVPFDDKAIKGVQVRLFKLSERDEAQAWIRS